MCIFVYLYIYIYICTWAPRIIVPNAKRRRARDLVREISGHVGRAWIFDDFHIYIYIYIYIIHVYVCIYIYIYIYIYI